MDGKIIRYKETSAYVSGVRGGLCSGMEEIRVRRGLDGLMMLLTEAAVAMYHTGPLSLSYRPHRCVFI